MPFGKQSHTETLLRRPKIQWPSHCQPRIASWTHCASESYPLVTLSCDHLVTESGASHFVLACGEVGIKVLTALVKSIVSEGRLGKCS